VKADYDVVIIGAGMAGVTAAHMLRAAGKQVCVLEKSRDLGGRMSTRVKSALQWDHGAQYFTAHSPQFNAQVLSWINAGVVERWEAPIGAWDGEQLSATEPQQRFLGVPFMKSPLRAMAQNIQIQLNTQVLSIEQHSLGWKISTESQHWYAKHVIVAVPSDQAKNILPPAHPAYKQAANLAMQPCWALMLATDTPINFPYAGIFINKGALGWVAQDSSKPWRNSHPIPMQTFVVQATPEWSASHLEQSAQDIAPILTDEFNLLLKRWNPQLPTPVWQIAIAHRWRYARGSVAHENIDAWPHDGLVLAGDWLMGGRVEGAYLSGLACAQYLISAQETQ
jgi:renalase